MKKNYKKCIQYLEEAWTVCQSIQLDNIIISELFYDLSLAYYWKGQFKVKTLKKEEPKSYQKSLDFAYKALQIVKAEFGNKHLKCADIYILIADINLEVQLNFWKARQKYKKAVKIMKKTAEDSNLKLADCYSKLMKISSKSVELGGIKKAIKYGLRNISYLKNQYYEDHVGVAHTLYELGIFYMESASYFEAIECFDQSQLIFSQNENYQLQIA